MPLTYGNLNGASVQDYELASGAAVVTHKSPVNTIAANSTGTQASGTTVPNIPNTNVSVTSAGSAYSVTLPPAVPGLEIDILSITPANTIVVFPSGTNTINALGAGNGLAFAALASATFMCMVAGQWFTSPRVPS
jgi:hypothetical protein